MDWNRILRDGIVPLWDEADKCALDDSLYHETRKNSPNPSKSKVVLPWISSPSDPNENTADIEEQEERLVRRMKKGKSRQVTRTSLYPKPFFKIIIIMMMML